jgi:hypothetical protein
VVTERNVLQNILAFFIETLESQGIHGVNLNSS